MTLSQVTAQLSLQSEAHSMGRRVFPRMPSEEKDTLVFFPFPDLGDVFFLVVVFFALVVAIPVI